MTVLLTAESLVDDRCNVGSAKRGQHTGGLSYTALAC